MIIKLIKSAGIKLLTKGKICEEDIIINPILQSKTVNANGEYTPDEGYCGFKEVVVSGIGVIPEGYLKPDGTKEIHANGTHDVTEYASVKVLVPDENSWCGEYDSSVNYKENAIVVYGTAVYLCIKDIDNQQPPTNEEYWELIYAGTSDATAEAGDVVNGLTFYGKDGKMGGTMPIASNSTFSSIFLEASGEKKVGVKYYSNKNAYILNNAGMTTPGTIAEITDSNFKAENIAEGVTLFGLEGKHAPTFDGTINIESGYTTISGSYVIDEQKAYDLLQTFGKVKTFNVKFSAGGSASGMGDSIDFTSMTFDGDYGFIKYNDKAAFAMNGGFAEYNNNYGDGNGARVQFEEGTECRKEFKELFLSIADEYAGASLISFTISGTSYEVESGTTWQEWGDKNGAELDGEGYVRFLMGLGDYNYITVDGTFNTAILGTSVITSGDYLYYLVDGGGSNE